MNNYTEQLNSFFQANKIEIDKTKTNQLSHYSNLVVEKNQIINLISRKDEEFIIENHVFISTFAALNFPTDKTSFLDIGTGGGFPGIPFSILNPEMQGILVDSTAKKILSVNEFIQNLNLKNIRAINARVESPDFVNQFKNKFDLIISRATAQLEILLKYSVPVTKKSFTLCAIKGGNLDEEIANAMKSFKSIITDVKIINLNYEPTNSQNEKEKKLIVLKLHK